MEKKEELVKCEKKEAQDMESDPKGKGPGPSKGRKGILRLGRRRDRSHSRGSQDERESAHERDSSRPSSADGSEFGGSDAAKEMTWDEEISPVTPTAPQEADLIELDEEPDEAHSRSERLLAQELREINKTAIGSAFIEFARGMAGRDENGEPPKDAAEAVVRLHNVFEKMQKEQARQLAKLREDMRKAHAPPPSMDTPAVRAPKEEDFSHYSSLSGQNSQKAQAARNAIGSKDRFDGVSKKSETDIKDLLRRLTLAQSSYKLSKTDFKNCLLGFLAREPFRIADRMLAEGASFQNVYDKLILNYYTGETPQVAEDKLLAIAGGKHEFTHLAGAEREITRLARIAAEKYMSEQHRSFAEESKAIQTLHAIMPDNIRPMVQADYKLHCNKSQSDCTLTEALRLLDVHRQAINSYLHKRAAKANGKNGKKDKGRGDSAYVRAAAADEPRDHAQGQANAVTRSQSRRNEGRGSGQGKPSGQDTTSGGARKKWSKKSEGTGGNSRDKGTRGEARRNQGDCSLCFNPHHETMDCPWFPVKARYSTSEKCTKCKLGAYHKEKYCPSLLLPRAWAQANAEDN